MLIAHIMSRRAIHFHHRFSVSNHLKEATSWAKLASLRSPRWPTAAKSFRRNLPKSWFSEKWDVSKVSYLSFRVIVHFHDYGRKTKLLCNALFFSVWKVRSSSTLFIHLLTFAGPPTGELTASAGKIRQHRELWEIGTAQGRSGIHQYICKEVDNLPHMYSFKKPTMLTVANLLHLLSPRWT